MRSFVIRSLVRSLIDSRNVSRCISTAAAARELENVKVSNHRFPKPGLYNSGFYWRRMLSSSYSPMAVPDKEEQKERSVAEEVKTGENSNSNSKAVVSSYWGITRPKINREDGTEWPWNCFMPWEVYHTDTSIDLTKHHVPQNATLKDVVTVIRADEAHHRDVNHFASDIQFQGKELMEAPAPLGYH